jgi:hypothetical protein
MEEQPDGAIIPVDPSELPADYFGAPPAQPAPVSKGTVLLPKRMTQAMRDVTDQEDWTWEDLLAAAEAITEDEYNEIATTPAAPVREHKELFGYEIWGHFYRTKEELLEAFVDKGIQWATPSGPFNGMNEEWVKANIREVYVHGVTALAKREAG